MSEWTLDTLKEYFESILSEKDRALSAALAGQEKAVSAALAAADRAVAKAEIASEKRFESVNEFRAVLTDQQRTLMPRTEVLAFYASVQEKYDTLVKIQSAVMPRLEADAALQSLADKLDAVVQRLNRTEGRGTGLQAGWGYLIGAVGLILTLLTIAGIVVAFVR